MLRQSVEKSELWVYKSKSAEEHGKNKNKDEDEEVVTERKNSQKKTPPTLSSSDKQGSAIDLDIGPPLHGDQAEEYRKIQQVIINSSNCTLQGKRPVVDNTSGLSLSRP